MTTWRQGDTQGAMRIDWSVVDLERTITQSVYAKLCDVLCADDNHGSGGPSRTVIGNFKDSLPIPWGPAVLVGSPGWSRTTDAWVRAMCLSHLATGLLMMMTYLLRTVKPGRAEVV